MMRLIIYKNQLFQLHIHPTFKMNFNWEKIFHNLKCLLSKIQLRLKSYSNNSFLKQTMQWQPLKKSKKKTSLILLVLLNHQRSYQIYWAPWWFYSEKTHHGIMFNKFYQKMISNNKFCILTEEILSEKQLNKCKIMGNQ